jgi:hypothetical protein
MDAFVSHDSDKSKFREKKNFLHKTKQYNLRIYILKKKQPEAMREKFYTTNLPPEAKG